MKNFPFPIADVLVVSSALLASQFGGRPWATIALSGLLPLRLLAPNIPILLGSLLLSVIWLAAHQYTGDLRLFFPFTLHFAVQLALGLPMERPRATFLGAGGILALFCVIRLFQSASLIVLLVEILVATFAIVVPVALYELGAPTQLRRICTVLLAALLAYLGLIF